ncbi:MOSPD2 [Bugula neritina]|uniref:MOSPD2 n=1 Tax=Bugula neritina TaxID=10212 RepID=A0A7J7KKV5_BUGNE|nr:MOSPD2 [Bugula neritina]
MAAPLDDLPESEKLRLAEEARTAFFRQYGAEAASKYDSRDVDRVRDSDTWLRHFLLHQKYRISDAVKMMDVTLSWRKEFGVNDITEESLPLYLRQRGAVYFHNKNLSGNDILYFKIKLNNKSDAAAVKASRLLITYLLDNYQKRKPLHRVVALLDMSDVGLTNVDIDLTKFLITCFTTYFPGMLEYLLVFDMPWIINTVWAVVKVMLSAEEQKRVIFCKKNSVQQYIDKSQLYQHMGGLDKHVFQYTTLLDGVEFDDEVAVDEEEVTTFQETEDHTEQSEQVPSDSPAGVTPPLPDITQQVPAATSNSHSKKQVNWAISHDVKEFTPPSTSSTPPESPQSKSAPHHEGENVSNSNSKPPLHHVTVLPTSELQFTRAGINEEAHCSLKLTNDQSVVLAYKVKTTDPKNYRVKQGRGLLAPSNSETVHITLLAGKEIKRDKFLVLSAKLDSADLTQSELAATWKTFSKSQIHEHKLRCHEAALDLNSSVSPVMLTSNPSFNSSSASGLMANTKSTTQEQTTSLELRLEKLQAEQDQVKLLLKIIIALLMLIISLIFAR